MQVSLTQNGQDICCLYAEHKANVRSTNGDYFITVAVLNSKEVNMLLIFQNLTLEKPKKKSGKIWGHSRTLSRVESLGFVSS